VILATEDGQSIRFREDEVRVMGRQAAGVKSIRLHPGDLVVGMDAVREQDTHVLVVTRNGFGKRTPVEDYGAQGRFGLGRRTLARNEKTGPVVAMRCINAKDDILIMTRNNVVLRTRLEQIREVSRNTVGVKLIDLADDDWIIGIAIMDGSTETLSDEMLLDETVSSNGNVDGAIAG
jgi:DNA gyrase subunit A